MAFTGAEETDLLLPLYQGVQENPRFSTFLTRVLRRTGAEHFAVIIRQRDALIGQRREFSAGLDLEELARESDIDEVGSLERVEGERLRLGRVYSPAEFTDHDPVYAARRTQTIERLGILDERVMRFFEEGGLTAWLVLGRGRPCSAADSALLSNLAPYVAAAIRSLVLSERQRVEAEMGAAGLGRSGAGWLVLDREARVITAEPTTVARLRETAGIIVRNGEPPRDLRPSAERELAAAAATFAADRNSPPRSVVLHEAPRVEALLAPAAPLPLAALRQPALLMVVRFPAAPVPRRAERLAHLFDLPLREAELAIALADGRLIAEAAADMGLTLETARNYSKKLYARLGVRGQAELVRLIFQSSAVLG